MVGWRKAPWTLRAFVAIFVAHMAVAVAITAAPLPADLFVVALAAVVCAYLLRGVRWLWILVVAYIPLSYALTSLDGSLRWHSVVLGVAYLALLLHPATRRFFRREAAAAAA